MGYPFYALNRLGTRLAKEIAVGDSCALYRARSGRGFIGLFEVTQRAIDTPTKVGGRTYATRISWKPILLCEDAPVDLQSLILELSFIKNKTQFGAYFQANLKRLSRNDFEVIERAVQRNARKQQSTRVT
jgi:predicted RNA-binding protein